jgi:hypothetical protein
LRHFPDADISTKDAIRQLRNNFRIKAGRDLTYSDVLDIIVKVDNREIDLRDLGLNGKLFSEITLRTVRKMIDRTDFKYPEGNQLKLLREGLETMADKKKKAFMAELSGGGGKTLVMLVLMGLKAETLKEDEFAEIILHNKPAVRAYIDSYSEFMNKAFEGRIKLVDVNDFRIETGNGNEKQLDVDAVARCMMDKRNLIIMDLASRESLQLSASRGESPQLKKIFENIKARGMDEIDEQLLRRQTYIIASDPKVIDISNRNMNNPEDIALLDKAMEALRIG